MKEIHAVISVPDVECEHCVKTVQEAIGGLPSVKNVQVNLETKQVGLTYDPDQVHMSEIEEKLNHAGYPIAPDLARGEGPTQTR